MATDYTIPMVYHDLEQVYEPRLELVTNGYMHYVSE